MKSPKMEKQTDLLWDTFQTKCNLSDYQVSQFKRYKDLLQEWNKKFNITTITQDRSIIKHHFADSLMLARFFDFKSIKSALDVGSGGGFPGIPLKIAFPHLHIVLLEVNKKKKQFLEAVISQLELNNIEVCDYDWRTFLRTTEGEIELFVSRAALPAEELTRLFKENSSYKNATLFYWADRTWAPDPKTAPFVVERFDYTLSHKQRSLIVMKKG